MQTVEQLAVKFLGHGVEHLACRGNGVFAHGLAREHPAQGIRNEEYLFSMLKCRIAVALHGIQLEQRVEVHKLDACSLIDIPLRHLLLEIGLHGTKGMGVAIGQRVAQQRTVCSHTDKIHSPGVYTNAGNFQSTLGHSLEAFDDFKIKGIDIPVEMSSCFDEIVWETCDFLQIDLSLRDCSNNCSSTCRSQIDCEEAF